MAFLQCFGLGLGQIFRDSLNVIHKISILPTALWTANEEIVNKLWVQDHEDWSDLTQKISGCKMIVYVLTYDVDSKSFCGCMVYSCGSRTPKEIKDGAPE